jgi:hypothetical protein
MKKKATTRKVVVKNSAFVAAIKESFSERTARHKKIVEQAKSSGTLTTLTGANKKNVSGNL